MIVYNNNNNNIENRYINNLNSASSFSLVPSTLKVREKSTAITSTLKPSSLTKSNQEFLEKLGFRLK